MVTWQKMRGLISSYNDVISKTFKPMILPIEHSDVDAVVKKIRKDLKRARLMVENLEQMEQGLLEWEGLI